MGKTLPINLKTFFCQFDIYGQDCEETGFTELSGDQTIF